MLDKRAPPRQLSLLGVPSRSPRVLGVTSTRDRSIVESPPHSPRSDRATQPSVVLSDDTGSLSSNGLDIDHPKERQTARFQEGDVLRDPFLASQWRPPPMQSIFDQGCVERTAHLSAVQGVAQAILDQDLIPSSVRTKHETVGSSREGIWHTVAGLKIAHSDADDFVHWIS
eukprot:1523128-Rhodomonas_salina.1